jgi:hypothetical protein
MSVLLMLFIVMLDSRMISHFNSRITNYSFFFNIIKDDYEDNTFLFEKRIFIVNKGVKG